jgi:hypothetical protein
MLMEVSLFASLFSLYFWPLFPGTLEGKIPFCSSSSSLNYLLIELEASKTLETNRPASFLVGETINKMQTGCCKSGQRWPL